MSARPKESKFKKFGKSFVEGVKKVYVEPGKKIGKGIYEGAKSIYDQWSKKTKSTYHQPPTRKMKHGGKVRNPFTEQYD